jgi:tetratricopeptide (TPR) repeat protein
MKKIIEKYMQSAWLPTMSFLIVCAIIAWAMFFCVFSDFDFLDDYFDFLYFLSLIPIGISLAGILIASIKQFKNGTLIKAYINLAVFLLLIGMNLYNVFIWEEYTSNYKEDVITIEEKVQHKKIYTSLFKPQNTDLDFSEEWECARSGCRDYAVLMDEDKEYVNSVLKNEKQTVISMIFLNTDELLERVVYYFPRDDDGALKGCFFSSATQLRTKTDKELLMFHIDIDLDGLSYDEEIKNGTDASNNDSDGDGWFDGLEKEAETNPLDIKDFPLDDCKRKFERLINNAHKKHAQGHIKEAWDDVQAAEKLSSKDSRVSLTKGNLYKDEKKFRKALGEYRKAIEIDDYYSVWAYNNRGRLLTEMGQFDKALKDLNKAVELDPSGGYVEYRDYILKMLNNS